MRCPATTGRMPGTRDQCEECGRIVYTRMDGTVAPHDAPGREAAAPATPSEPEGIDAFYARFGMKP